MQMEQQTILEVLESLNFGQDAAENEDNLKDLFIKGVDVYQRFVDDEVDVVTGSKGSGKSAIFRMVTENPVHDDLHVIPAVNPTGSPVFRVLFEEDASEERLRGIWTAYATSVIGNWVVDHFDGDRVVGPDVNEVREILQLLGLRKLAAQKRSLLSRIRSATSVEAGAGASLAGAMNASLKFTLPGDAAGTSAIVLGPEDFHGVIKKCSEILNIKSERLWVAFDRLDECFLRDSKVERRALRALLRAHLDVSQLLTHDRTVRLKIFIRTDLMSRMSVDATFTNSTHLRQADLRWNSDAIAHMITRRATQSSLFSSTYLAGVPARQKVEETWQCLLPNVTSNGLNRKRRKAQRYATAHSICERTADGNRGFNPRNVISLLTMATSRASDRQRQAILDGRANRAEMPVIQLRELQAAEADLSRKRLQDSVKNEFQMIAKYVPRLEGGPSEFETVWGLMERIAVEGVTIDEAEGIANELCLSGVISAYDKGFKVPFLYRAALRTHKVPLDTYVTNTP
jgi:hypothetical protein